MGNDRRAVAVQINHEILEYLIDVPSGLRVVSIRDDFDRMCVVVVLEPLPGSLWEDRLPIIKPGQPIEYRDILYDKNDGFMWDDV